MVTKRTNESLLLVLPLPKLSSVYSDHYRYFGGFRLQVKRNAEDIHHCITTACVCACVYKVCVGEFWKNLGL